MFEIVFYKDQRGNEPVRDFILAFSSKMRQKIGTWINLLEREGPFLRRMYEFSGSK